MEQPLLTVLGRTAWGNKRLVTASHSNQMANHARPIPGSRALAVDYPDVRIVSDEAGKYLVVSRGSRRVLGWDPEELQGHTPLEFVHPDDAPTLELRWERLMEDRVITTSYRMRSRDGSYVLVEDNSRLIENTGLPVVVSALHNLDEGPSPRHRRHAPATDTLTGLPGRASLVDWLGRAIRRLDRDRGVLAVIEIDIDRFSQINVSMSREVGDSVLTEIARRLSGHAGPTDILARAGGDEFVLVTEALPNIGTAKDLASSLLEDCRKPIAHEEGDVIITASAGMTATADPQAGAEELLREVHLALYRAKENGRDRAEAFSEELRTRAVDRLGTERMLRAAIAENRIVVEYQPILDLATTRVIGTEALVRIRDEDALLYPSAFLAVASDTGLLLEVDQRVLETSLHQMADWGGRLWAEGSGSVAINVTAKQLEQASFSDIVLNQLQNHNVPPVSLHLEITEHNMIEASTSAISTLAELRGYGLKVGLDDFGTGYSSLAYLRQLPVDFVKIDKSFVAAMETDDQGPAIVAAVIELARALGLEVVAEGIENTTQLAMLTDMGCHKGQGYLFAASGPAKMIDALVFSGRTNGLLSMTSRGA
jgi:diguanylate cyclase (GGDEF)-like protein/PAS domain S-box-containing protein